MALSLLKFPIREINHRVYVKRQTRNGRLLFVLKKHENYVILSRFSHLKSHLIPAANTQEKSSYQKSFFHFWQNANFSPRLKFAVNVMLLSRE